MAISRLKRISAGLAMAALLLTGCGGDMDDLDQYINSVKARPGGRIEPLPEITPYEVFTYVADAEGLRSPFQPDLPEQAASSGRPATRGTGSGNRIRAKATRPRSRRSKRCCWRASSSASRETCPSDVCSAVASTPA